MEYYSSINGLRFSLENLAGNTLSYLLINRKHGCDIQQFIVSLEYVNHQYEY